MDDFAQKLDLGNDRRTHRSKTSPRLPHAMSMQPESGTN